MPEQNYTPVGKQKPEQNYTPVSQQKLKMLEGVIATRENELNKSLMVAESNSIFLSKAIVNLKYSECIGEVTYEVNDYLPRYLVRIICLFKEGHYKLQVFNSETKEKIKERLVKPNDVALISETLSMIYEYQRSE